MSIIIAGERSGAGKTTVTLALLSYLRQQNLSVQSFKVGPDYIDPMFHHYVTGRPCRNLDPVLTSEAYVQTCFRQHSQTAEYALVEGVMGLFDGATEEVRRQKVEEGNRQAEGGKGGRGGRGDQTQELPHLNQPFQGIGGVGSTAHVARLLNLPVLLVVDCSRMSQSITALVHGYCNFDANLHVVGLVLNRVGSDRHLELLQTALEPLHLPILGVLRRQDSITIPDRHLGLLPTAELPQLDALIEQLADFAEEWFDWKQMMPLLRQEEERSQASQSVSRQEAGGRSQGGVYSNLREAYGSSSSKSKISLSPTLTHSPTLSPSHSPVRVAIARDAAFSFYYADNLDLLETLGAELVFWSPLEDAVLPDNVQGLILGGGFPEMFAMQLAANVSARKAVREAILTGMPTYAECGGLMYLCEAILDFERQSWEMAGIFPTTAVMGSRLTLGYRQVEAQRDSVMLAKGAIAWGHEFHRSYLTVESPDPLFSIRGQQVEAKQSGIRLRHGFDDELSRIEHAAERSQELEKKCPSPCNAEGWHLPKLHASYVHLHWGETPELPERFLEQCRNFNIDHYRSNLE